MKIQVSGCSINQDFILIDRSSEKGFLIGQSFCSIDWIDQKDWSEASTWLDWCSIPLDQSSHVKTVFVEFVVTVLNVGKCFKSCKWFYEAL